MKRSVWLWGLFGFATVSLSGTLLHFLYEWLGEARWIAPFSGVNESTWEHMKLLFFPAFLFAVIQSLFFRDYESFWCVKLRGILIGLISIPVLFYTYNGVIGRSPDWVNISIFFISLALAFIYESKRLSRGDASCRSKNIPLAILLLIAAAFVLFTFTPPPLDVFKDPLTGKYGC